MKLKELKKGDYFKLKNAETAPVWVKGEYIRSERRYSTHKFDDANHERLVPGKVDVITEFEF